MRFSSLGMVGKEKTAERKAHVHSHVFPNVKYNMVQCGATHRLLSCPPRPHLHSLHTSLHQKQTNRKQSASGVIDEERHRKQRRRNVRGYSILTSCLNNPSTPDALISLSDSNRPSGILQLLCSFNNNSWASGIVLLIREGEEKLGEDYCFLMPQRCFLLLQT